MGKQTSDETTLEVIKIYFEDWKFRQSIANRQIAIYFVANGLVTVFPVIKDIFKVDTKDFPIWIFPILGIGVSIIYFMICLFSAERLAKIYEKIDELMGIMDVKYKRIPVGKGYKVRMAVWVPLSLTILQNMVAIAVLLYLV